MAEDWRRLLVDQTQSMNIFPSKNSSRLANVQHLNGGMKYLRNDMYYLHTTPDSDTNTFGIDFAKVKEFDEKYNLLDMSNQPQYFDMVTNTSGAITPIDNSIIEASDDDLIGDKPVIIPTILEEKLQYQ